jgi:hypothetical protein
LQTSGKNVSEFSGQKPSRVRKLETQIKMSWFDCFQDDVKSYCLLIADEMDGEVDFDLPGKV